MRNGSTEYGILCFGSSQSTQDTVDKCSTQCLLYFCISCVLFAATGSYVMMAAHTEIQLPLETDSQCK